MHEFIVLYAHAVWVECIRIKFFGAVIGLPVEWKAQGMGELFGFFNVRKPLIQLFSEFRIKLRFVLWLVRQLVTQTDDV